MREVKPKPEAAGEGRAQLCVSSEVKPKRQSLASCKIR